MSSKSRPDCEELRSRLQELTEVELQDQIPAPLRERLLAHAIQCPECEKLLGSYRALLSELTSLPRVKAPAEFPKNVLAAILDEGRSSGPSGPVGRGIVQPRVLAASVVEETKALRARRRKLPHMLLRAAALLLFAAMGWLAAERWTSRRAAPPQDLVIRAPKEVPEKPTVGSRESAGGTEAPAARNDENRPDTVAMADKKIDALSLAKEEVAAKAEVETGALGDGASASSDLVIPIPPQDEQGMRSLIAVVDSFAREPGSVERRDDPVAHQKLIVFEMDAGRAEELRASLQDFQSDRYAVTRGLVAERARAPIAGGAGGLSRRGSPRDLVLEKDVDARGGLPAGEGMARDGKAESKEFAEPEPTEVAAAAPVAPQGAALGKPAAAFEKEQEARKNERPASTVSLAGAPAPARRSAARQPAAPAAASSAPSPPTPPATAPPAPSSAVGRELPPELAVRPVPNADARPLADDPQALVAKLRQEAVAQKRQPADPARGFSLSENLRKGGEAGLRRQPSPEEDRLLLKDGEMEALGAAGPGAAGAGPMPEGAPRTKEKAPAAASFFAPQGAAVGSPPPPPAEDFAAGAKLKKAAPPAKVRVVIRVELK